MDRIRQVIGLSAHAEKAEVQRRLTAQTLRLRRVDADIDAQRAALVPRRIMVGHPRRRSTDA